MCDEQQLEQFRQSGPGIDRRRFAGLVAATGTSAALMACNAVDAGAEAESSTAAATGGGVLGGEVAIPTDGGTIGGWFYHPAAGNHPAVIMWPDIAGIRPASKAMGERLAGEGFVVIVPDPYWRDEGHAMFDDFADLLESGGFDVVKPWRERLGAESAMADARAIVAWLDAQDVVDRTRGIGARGHCMTGAWPIYAAKASDRVTVAASLHGGGLVTNAPDSPHRQLVGDAHYHIAVAQNDDAKEPQATAALREALAQSGAKGEVVVYPADHGWSVPDVFSYDRAEAERAYATFLSMVRDL